MPCCEVAQLLLPVIPFSVHLSPVKSRPEIKFKNDSLAVSFLMESAQHIAPCTCNCDCNCLSHTITKKKIKIKTSWSGKEITFLFRVLPFFNPLCSRQYLQEVPSGRASYKDNLLENERALERRLCWWVGVQEQLESRHWIKSQAKV